jgi:hypothetical protein
MDSFNSFSQTFISHLKRLSFWFNQDKTLKGYKNVKNVYQASLPTPLQRTLLYLHNFHPVENPSQESEYTGPSYKDDNHAHSVVTGMQRLEFDRRDNNGIC